MNMTMILALLGSAMRLMQRRQDQPALDDDGPKEGSTEWLQTALNKLGAELEVDGNYGPGTKAAVEAFQTEHDLKVDGWAGPQTLARLVDELD